METVFKIWSLFEPLKAEWEFYMKLPEDFFVKITPGSDQLDSWKTGKVVKIKFTNGQHAMVTELQVYYSPVIIDFGKFEFNF